VTCCSRGEVLGWDLASGFGLWSLRPFGHSASAVAHSPDGQLLAAVGLDQKGRRPVFDASSVVVLDARTGRELRRIRLGDTARGLAWLPDNRHLLIGCRGAVRLWEVNQPSEVAVISIGSLMEEAGVAQALALEPSGRSLLVGTDCRAELWSLAWPEGKEAGRLAGHDAGMGFFRPRATRALDVSADGALALSGGNDGTARVWDIATGQQAACFNGHIGWWGYHGVTGVAFLPGGLAASASEDGTLRLWDAASARELSLMDHGRGIRSLTVSRDGQVALTGAWDGSVRVWCLGRP
jgi:WD40 repeat protein